MIDADKVRELCARGENSALDFKEHDYNWVNKGPANAELARDIMAMANGLGPHSEPAYILIGVDDSGKNINGIPVADHEDDAALHQKVMGALNRVPKFAYAPVEVDGRSIGVYEIRPGGRPYFALKEVHGHLRKHCAMYRNGSSTDVASPTMILEWAREDDPDHHRVRALEIRKLEAEARPHGELSTTHVNVTQAGDLDVQFRMTNLGRAGFSVMRASWKLVWNAEFQKNLKGPLPADYEAPSGSIEMGKFFVDRGERNHFKWNYTRADGLKHIKAANLPIAGFSPSWGTFHVTAWVLSDMREEATIEHVITVE